MADAYGVGDNKEFAVAGTGQITIHLYNSEGKTAANDDPATGNYYIDNPRVAKKFVLRTDQTLQIVKLGSLHNITLTNPITVAIGDGTVIPAAGIHREEYDAPTVHYITLNIQTANTNLKLRVY